MPRIAVCSLAVLLLGCGPSAPDDAQGSEGAGGSTSAPDPEDETEGSDEGSDGGSDESSTGAPDPLPELLIENARHGYECIDGCESFYSNESLRLTLTSETTRTAEVELQDWTLGDRALSSDDDPILVETVDLVAGEPVEVRLSDSRTGFCSFEDWSGPARIRLHIDGVAVEVEGYSSAGSGWDC